MSAAENPPDIVVFYDGHCPVCRWEVRLYKRLDKARRIQWTDIETLSGDKIPQGKTREELLGKFHVHDLGGETEDWHVGVDAFAHIWRALPGFRYFAFLFRVPGIRQAAMAAYKMFLQWQSWYRKHRVRPGKTL